MKNFAGLLVAGMLAATASQAATVTNTYAFEARGTWLPLSEILRDMGFTVAAMDGLIFTGAFEVSFDVTSGNTTTPLDVSFAELAVGTTLTTPRVPIASEAALERCTSFGCFLRVYGEQADRLTVPGTDDFQIGFWVDTLGNVLDADPAGIVTLDNLFIGSSEQAVQRGLASTLDVAIAPDISPVPLAPAAALFVSGIVALGLLRPRRKKALHNVSPV